MLHALIILLAWMVAIIVVVGALLWGINGLPIDTRIKQAVRIIVLLIAVLMILSRALPMLGVGM